MYEILCVIIGVFVVVIFCGIDLWQICMDIDVICIDDLVLVQEVSDFICDCYGFVCVKLFMIWFSLSEEQMYDVIWIGFSYFVGIVGFYDSYCFRILCDVWLFDVMCDVGLV